MCSRIVIQLQSSKVEIMYMWYTHVCVCGMECTTDELETSQKDVTFNCSTTVFIVSKFKHLLRDGTVYNITIAGSNADFLSIYNIMYIFEYYTLKLFGNYKLANDNICM